MTIQPVPWSTPAYQVGSGTGRRAALTRFVDDATRPQPFGGETMTLRNNTGGNPGVEECLEIAPAGWDDVTGTFNPRCSDPWTSPSRFTGVVNHETDGGGQAVRRQEIGQRDNRNAVGVATIRRLGGPDPWNEPGFGWFQHRAATAGCLMLRVINHADDMYQEAVNEEVRLEALGREQGALYANCPPGTPAALCTQAELDAKQRHVEIAMEMLGWRAISRWRYRTHAALVSGRMLPEYQIVSGSNTGVLTATGKGPTWIGAILGLDVENNRCYTGPVGGSTINERLASTASYQVSANEWLNPAWSGKTFWGSDMQTEAWWDPAGGRSRTTGTRKSGDQ